jgi:methane/ammonia monooxygenase subunit B
VLLIAGDPAAFTNQVKTLDGNVIDMETYGLAAFLLLAAGPGSHMGLWHFRTGFAIMKYVVIVNGKQYPIEIVRENHLYRLTWYMCSKRYS